MRKHDSMWRDETLADWHKAADVAYPAAGMAFPTIEYDYGVPVALINYLRRDTELPTGPDVGSTYRAFGNLGNETGPLPFFTVRYDNRKWAYQVFTHNDPARREWASMTEQEYAAFLYSLRGRKLPLDQLAAAGVTFADTPWHGGFVRRQEDEPWPGASMSVRRRNFEPTVQLPHRTLIPCTDIDLAVIGSDGRAALVVDYKAGDGPRDLKGPSLRAMAGLWRQGGKRKVPAMMVRYTDRGHSENGPVWMFSVACLNRTAQMMLSFVLGSQGSDALADAVAGSTWVGLSEAEWVAVLEEAAR